MTNRVTLSIIGGLAVGFAMSTSAGFASAQPGEGELIPREVLFGNPELASFRASPTGEYFSWLAPKDGVLNVWIAPVDDINKAHAVTNDTYRGIRQYFWAYNGTHIVYFQDKGGDENFYAFAIDINTGDENELTPFDGARAMLQQTNPENPDEILISVNNRNPQLFDLYRVNVVTGEMTQVIENTGYLGYTTDDQYNVRFAAKYDDNGSMNYYEVKGTEVSPEVYLTVPSSDSLTTSIVGFNHAGDTLYLIDSRTGNTAALFARDMNTGQTDMLYENDLADVSGTMVNPKTRVVEAAASNYLRTTWDVLDPAIAKDMKYLRTVQDGEIHITSRVAGDSLWTIAFVRDNGPVEYWKYDRKAGQAEFVFSNRPELDKLELAKMHPVVIKARDGLNLVSYLTLPTWADTDGDGKPSEALPMVLFVHGGPWARDSWGYNPYHQWLANRGYAVLSVNYRGSTGFGKEFINAGNFEWAGKMHDDLLDAVQWAEDQGIADRDRVGIMGGSYGGYATLVGLTFTPKEFACGVDIVGPSNILTLLSTIPPYWKPAMELFNTRVGDMSTDEGKKLLESRSPLNFVDKIERPLLIGQGANDPRVKQSEADQIVNAMEAKGIPVTYVLFPDEGHGFARPENNLAFNAVAEAFLAEHLGGRYEPIDDDFKGSTIDVPTGAAEVPGLGGALDKK